MWTEDKQCERGPFLSSRFEQEKKKAYTGDRWDTSSPH